MPLTTQKTDRSCSSPTPRTKKWTPKHAGKYTFKMEHSEQSLFSLFPKIENDIMAEIVGSKPKLQFHQKLMRETTDYSTVTAVLLVYLSVSLGDLLIQALVAVDGELQLLHLGW